ncbi:hypothetical protein TNIN_425801 [Trichonephila inaurata madagascariensis]|uniref:Uncharacterized protein n=1 Tax=Trichonephila inaurata madagascariensis TaxID=2747483 RepID=A0A8X7BPQ5_9ARAC|nr:hypothetical protein TNIN_425801 [Trichonephila inaurata madagascariensis]
MFFPRPNPSPDQSAREKKTLKKSTIHHSNSNHPYLSTERGLHIASDAVHSFYKSKPTDEYSPPGDAFKTCCIISATRSPNGVNGFRKHVPHEKLRRTDGPEMVGAVMSVT